MTRTHVTTTRVVNAQTGAVSFVQSTTPFTSDENTAADAAEAAAALIVPASVTPYQARKALSDAGLRDVVEAAVNGASLDVQDAWHYGISVERASPMIAALSASLGLSSAQVDTLFRAASKIT